MRIRTFVSASGVVLCVGVNALSADAPARLRVRGTIASIDTKSVSITQADGTTVTASLAPSASFATVESRTFDQIKATDFVGVTSLPGPNDTLLAQEIHILPVKGYNEGSFPWDNRPVGAKPTPASLTHGTVAGVHDQPPSSYTMTNANVTAASGMQLQVSYRGSAMVGGKCVGRAVKGARKPCTGVSTIEVSPLTPIVAIIPGASSDAKPGLAVFASVTAGPAGKKVVLSMLLEKNGVKPPL